MSSYAPPKLQVFISSTFADLRVERQAAVQAILKEGHIPAGMELFTDVDENHIEAIKRWIDNADVYILILGKRYGAIEPATGKGYLQLEYEYAIKRGIPVFSCLINDAKLDAPPAKKASRKTDTHSLGQKWWAFRQLASKNMVVEWNDHTDISRAVRDTLTALARKNNLSGWIKLGDESNLFPGNISFQTVSPFPGFFPVLCQNLESAQESIDIMCDYPAYGFFSDHSAHRRYKGILEKKVRDGIDLQILSPNKAIQKKLLIEQFGIDARPWNEIREDKQVKPNLLQFEENHQRTFLDADSFVAKVLEIQEDMFDDKWLGENFRLIDKKPPLLYWIADKSRAVISIPTFSSNAYEVGLKTKDKDLIQTLISIKDFITQDASVF